MASMVVDPITIGKLQNALNENAEQFHRFIENLKVNVENVMSAYPGDTQTENLFEVVSFDAPRIEELVNNMQYFSCEYLEKKKGQVQAFLGVNAPC